VSGYRPVRTTQCLRASAVAGALAIAALASGCGSGSPNATAAPSTSQSRYRQLVSFSQCMRTHGVPSFPDPVQNGNGSVGLEIRDSPGSGISPKSPAFQSAQKACGKLLPNGGKPHALTAGDKQQFLRFAECMRTHGVPSFPDPNFSGGGARVQIGGPGVSPKSPAFKAAQQSCRAYSPFKGGIAGP
jgi:hypothetical protein